MLFKRKYDGVLLIFKTNVPKNLGYVAVNSLEDGASDLAKTASKYKLQH